MSSAGPGTSRWAFVALLTMTAIWGSTFFLIKDIVTRIPVPDLLALRFAIATIALTTMAAGRLKLSYPIVARGLALGLLYGTAQLLQTVGLAHTPRQRVRLSHRPVRRGDANAGRVNLENHDHQQRLAGQRPGHRRSGGAFPSWVLGGLRGAGDVRRRDDLRRPHRRAWSAESTG